MVAAAGNLEHEQIAALAERCVDPDQAGAESMRNGGPTKLAAVPSFYKKDTEQFHVCIGGTGIPRNDERRYVLAVLDAILGGGSSSRLFQEVREKRGLAYSVYSWASQYSDTGQVGVYVGTRPDNVGEAMKVIGTELKRILDPVGADELDRAREQVKGRMALSMESTRARMNRLGSSVLMGTPILSLDETFEKVDAVSVADVEALAAEIYDPSKLSAAAVGSDEAIFTSSLPAVGAHLEAA